MSRLTGPMILGIGGLIFVLYVALWCVPRTVDRVETDILARSSAVVASSRGDIEVSVDGQRVTLAGSVLSESARQVVVRSVSALSGVAEVIDSLQVAQANPVVVARPAAYRFEARFQTDQVVLTGFVPSDGVRASIVGHARRRFASARVIDQLSGGDGAPQGFGEFVKDGITQLGRLDRGVFRFDGRRAVLEGVAPEPDARQSIEAALARLGRGAFAVSAQVSVRPATDARRAGCQSQYDRALRGQTVSFATSSATISADSFPLLDELAGAAKSCADVRVGVHGHTDSMGDPQFNLNLSQQRAQAVVDYLIDEGVPRANLRARGFGASEPRESNDTRAGRAANRRIEFIVLNRDAGEPGAVP
ncbi:MAG: OmpA family protein [Gammaproteobacteria bacterium]